MKRRHFLQQIGLLGLGTSLLPHSALAALASPQNSFTRSDFGPNFHWGVATAAYQIEGAWNLDGKGPSVWDHFTHKKKKKIRNGENGDQACDFYHRYTDDLQLLKDLGFKVYRFSIAWSRIFPKGTGEINQAGLEYYHKIIDTCLNLGLEPWITLYHWDLPQALENKGGWANRKVLDWFKDYCEVVTKAYGSKVKNWMILNEPAAFTALGYLGGIHAPGKVSARKFLAATHHASLAMGIGGRIVRANVPQAYVGTTFSCSPIQPKKPNKANKAAARRLDALLNRLFIEPVLGLGYPTKDLPFLRKIKRYIRPGDAELLPFEFDFVGLQNYTQVIAKKALIPYLWANQVKPSKRGIAPEQRTLMDWEVYPQGIYEIIKQFARYPKLPPIIITENGAAFEDKVGSDDKIHDQKRVQFFQDYLGQVLKAKREGVDIRGYFVWTFLDNFEWAEGYRPRFGLVHVDFKTQQRRVKDSGYWFKNFLTAPEQ
jgi:beta-glucosidase